MPYPNSVASPNANSGFIPPVESPEVAYFAQAGRRKASIRRFALNQRGGAARKIVDVKACGTARHPSAVVAGITARGPAPVEQVAVAPAPVQQVAMAPVTFRPAACGPIAPGLQPAAPRPVAEPAALFPIEALPPSAATQERAVHQGAVPVLSASPSPSAGGDVATPLQRAATSFVNALRGIRNWIHDGSGTTKHRSREISAPMKISGPMPVSNPIPDASGRNHLKFAPARPSELPTYKSADLIQNVAHLLRKDELLDIMVRFSGEGITYQNLLYLLEQRWYRIQADEAGQGLGAPLGGTADSLARRLVCALRSHQDPWRVLNSVHDLEVKHPDLVVARERYLAYRDEHYPDFPAILQRLTALSADAPVDAIKANIQAKRTESEAQRIPFDVDAYIRDNPLDPKAEHPITATQLSEDLQKLQQCTPAMANFIEQLDLADCLRESLVRQVARMPAGQP